MCCCTWMLTHTFRMANPSIFPTISSTSSLLKLRDVFTILNGGSPARYYQLRSDIFCKPDKTRARLVRSNLLDITTDGAVHLTSFLLKKFVDRSTSLQNKDLTSSLFLVTTSCSCCNSLLVVNNFEHHISYVGWRKSLRSLAKAYVFLEVHSHSLWLQLSGFVIGSKPQEACFESLTEMPLHYWRMVF